MRTSAKISLVLFIALVLALSAACAFAAAEKQATGPDSFMKWRAYTVEDLLEQVESDSVIRQRLAKHFHVSQAELVTYFRDNLTVVRFGSSGWRTVYGVNSIGWIYKSRDYFNKGAKAFGLADGTPILKYACGNPLVTDLPQVEKKKIVEAPPAIEKPAVEVIAPPAPFHSPKEYALLPGIPLASSFSVAPALEVTRNLPLWPLLLLIDDGDDDPPVPEPATLVLFGGGLALLGGRLLRHRNSRN